MSVVALKPYSYLDWLRVVAFTNEMRRRDGHAVWSNDDAWLLWQALFRA